MRHGPPKTTARPSRASPKGRGAVQRGPAARRKAPPGAKAAEGAASPPAWSEPLSVFLTSRAPPISPSGAETSEDRGAQGQPTRLHLRNYTCWSCPDTWPRRRTGLAPLHQHPARADLRQERHHRPAAGRAGEPVHRARLSQAGQLGGRLQVQPAGPDALAQDRTGPPGREFKRVWPLDLADRGRRVLLFLRGIQNYHDAPGRSEIAFRSGALPPTSLPPWPSRPSSSPGDRLGSGGGQRQLLNEVFVQAPTPSAWPPRSTRPPRRPWSSASPASRASGSPRPTRPRSPCRPRRSA